MEQIPSQPQRPSLSDVDDADSDAFLSRLVGKTVLVYTLLAPATPISTTIFHGALREVYPDAIVLEAGPGPNSVTRPFLIYKHAIVSVEPAASPIPPGQPQPF